MGEGAIHDEGVLPGHVALDASVDHSQERVGHHKQVGLRSAVHNGPRHRHLQHR